MVWESGAPSHGTSLRRTGRGGWRGAGRPALARTVDLGRRALATTVCVGDGDDDRSTQRRANGQEQHGPFVSTSFEGARFYSCWSPLSPTGPYFRFMCELEADTRTFFKLTKNKIQGFRSSQILSTEYF